jgi:hypothetical protein
VQFGTTQLFCPFNSLQPKRSSSFATIDRVTVVFVKQSVWRSLLRPQLSVGGESRGDSILQSEANVFMNA